MISVAEFVPSISYNANRTTIVVGIRPCGGEYFAFIKARVCAVCQFLSTQRFALGVYWVVSGALWRYEWRMGNCIEGVQALNVRVDSW